MTTLISHKHRYIFIHIPKNAGSSLQTAMLDCEDWVWMRKAVWRLFMLLGIKKQTVLTTRLSNPQIASFSISAISGHAHARHVKEALPGGIFDSYFKFAIVRNPWDRSVSRYEYFKMLSKQEDLTFRAFLEKDFQPQKLRISDDDGNILVDYVGRFENLAEDVGHIFERCGLPLTKEDIPFLNRSPRSKYLDYYDDFTRKLVADRYAEDVQEFGYTFEQMLVESRRAGT